MGFEIKCRYPLLSIMAIFMDAVCLTLGCLCDVAVCLQA